MIAYGFGALPALPIFEATLAFRRKVFGGLIHYAPIIQARRFSRVAKALQQ